VTTVPAKPPARTVSPVLRVGISYVLYALVWTVVFAVVVALLLLWVPGYRRVFMDFRMALPRISEQVLALSDSLRHGILGYVLIFFMIVALPIVPALLTGLPSRRAVRVAVAVLMLLVIGLAATGMVSTIAFAMHLPMERLVQSISGAESGQGE
jgi:type II secretory pathway component PulF